ncbi:MAG: fatty acyl-AMP ligase, partial [Pyrinomonadaceae bacterium]
DEDSGPPTSATEPDALAYIQYTSGSTSAPRGVPIRHGQLMHNQQMIRSAFGVDEEATAVSWLPHFHDMGLVGMVQQPVYSGFFTVMMSPLEFIRRPARWLRAISKYGAHTSGAPNFAYDLCVERVTTADAAALDLSRWTRAFNGSEPVRAETLERFAARFAPCGFRATSFRPCYGLAEATLFVAGGGEARALTLSAPPVGAGITTPRGAASEVTRRVVNCGRAWGGGRVVIADPETFARSGAGEVGEVWVAGPHVAAGYWRRPGESLETFRAYLSDTGDGPFLRTGDLGFLDGGELYVTGRLKDLIILRGKNHYPHDIEATVAASHTDLRPNCAAAFSVEVGGLEELVVLQEVKSATRAERVSEMSAAIRQSLAEDHAVKAYAVVLLRPNTVPRTSSGKIRRSACRDKFVADAFRTEALC